VDITDRKHAEMALEQADRRKDEFLATLAHELRNPLAPIRNAVQILLFKESDDPELRWSRDVIDRQVQQMARLLDDLLDVSRISHNKLELRRELTNLSTVVQSAVETSRPLIDAGKHTLTVSLPREPVHVDADPVRLAQVFSNLLNNAAKYTERGGHLRIDAHRAGDHVVVSVKDDGIGISADTLPRIFDMFSQERGVLERSQGGLGIGLALVRGLVELHGGTVIAKSAGLDRGSEFVVSLPSFVPPAVEAPIRDGEEAVGRRHRILVVDDGRDSADSLALLLAMKGHDVRTAYDGEQALEAARDDAPNVVLLDLGMPKLNGYDVCRVIREEPWGKDMIVIALTGWGQETDRRGTEEAGFDHHLVKPVDPDTLGEVLDSLAAQRELS
jgi:CheY-like chemotaxis protein/two-component sensor histidine kinase